MCSWMYSPQIGGLGAEHGVGEVGRGTWKVRWETAGNSSVQVMDKMRPEQWSSVSLGNDFGFILN